MSEIRYLIEDLCELTGFSRRTIRYYIQSGLLDPPAGRGRGGFYSEAHAETLRRIKSLQGQGLRLSAIAAILKTEIEGTDSGADQISATTARVRPEHPTPGTVGEGPRPPPPLKRDVWLRYAIVPGIEIHVSRALEEEERNRIEAAIKAARSILTGGEKDE